MPQLLYNYILTVAKVSFDYKQVIWQTLKLRITHYTKHSVGESLLPWLLLRYWPRYVALLGSSPGRGFWTENTDMDHQNVFDLLHYIWIIINIFRDRNFYESYRYDLYRPRRELLTAVAVVVEVSGGDAGQQLPEARPEGGREEGVQDGVDAGVAVRQDVARDLRRECEMDWKTNFLFTIDVVSLLLVFHQGRKWQYVLHLSGPLIFYCISQLPPVPNLSPYFIMASCQNKIIRFLVAP